MYPGINFFHANVCHVCKLTSHDVKLRYCGKCRSMAYCNQEHQKQHWKKHRKICGIITQINNMEEFQIAASMLKNDHLKLKSLFMSISETLLKRRLTPFELSMVYFAKKCFLCDEKNNLQDCSNCLSYSACPNHYDGLLHEFECKSLKLCLDAHIYKSKSYSDPSFTVRENLTKFNDMNSFISNQLLVEGESTPVTNSFISDLITRPLTIFYALTILNITPENLVLHIIGSTPCEVDKAEYWTLLNTLRMTKSIELSFVGPEIPDCETLKMDDLTVECSSSYYHDFVKTSKHPTAIVAFNCGFHEFENDAEDTWASSFDAILSRKVPVILTSYTLNEAVRDVARLRLLRPDLRVLQISNPYASLSPLRDVESSGVFFINSILSILCP